MKQSLFRKAKAIVNEFVFVGSVPWQEFWQLNYKTAEGKNDNISVRIEQGEHGITLHCTCKNCSIHDNKFLCSYKLAVIMRKGIMKLTRDWC